MWDLIAYLFTMHQTVPDQEDFYTANFLNTRTPKAFVVITLKFELCGSTIE